MKALAHSPWGIFTVGATIPIAMLMGGYLRFGRVGKVGEASVIGVVLLLLAVWGGQFVHSTPAWAKAFTLDAEMLAWLILIYGFAASVLPVWLLLAPRDYLSTFMKLGTIFVLVMGVFVVLPKLQMPPITKFIDGSGLVMAGTLFPFCFITIACGAISGFHTLISSGTTPKIITRESHSRPIGYGAMCLESLVAIMALIAACTLDPGVYLGMNIKGQGATPAEVAANTVAKVQGAGFALSVGQMETLAEEVGETTLFDRTGGAATLAVGMTQIFTKLFQGHWSALWYHFAIMFEALFILTTLDAGTRVGRYLLQDVLGNFFKPLGDTKKLSSNVIASGLVVGGWGYFLIQGVRDPLGGINSLWPLFGIANQLLASIALCLATTVILKMHLQRRQSGQPGRPAYALVTLIPLLWLLSVTITAGVQKIFHQDPAIGFLAQTKVLTAARPALEAKLTAARAEGVKIKEAEKAVQQNQSLRFNARLNAVVAGTFLILVAAIVVLSFLEWSLLLAKRRLLALHETAPVWLPDYALAEGKSVRLFGLLALTLSLLRELSGTAQLERAEKSDRVCTCPADPQSFRIDLLGERSETPRQRRQRLYAQAAEDRFSRPNRCC